MKRVFFLPLLPRTFNNHQRCLVSLNNRTKYKIQWVFLLFKFALPFFELHSMMKNCDLYFSMCSPLYQILQIFSKPIFPVRFCKSFCTNQFAVEIYFEILTRVWSYSRELFMHKQNCAYQNTVTSQTSMSDCQMAGFLLIPAKQKFVSNILCLSSSNFIELLKQRIVLNISLLSNNEQDTSHKWCVWNSTLVGYLIVLSIIFCYATLLFVL